MRRSSANPPTVAALLVVAFASHGSQAAPATVRVLLWPEAGSAASGSIEERLASGLAARGIAASRSDDLRLGPAVEARGRSVAQELKAIEASVEGARRAFLDFRFDDARNRLGALVAEHLPALSSPSHAQLLGAILRLGAQVDLAQGREASARERLRTALALAADVPSGDAANPEILKLEDEVRGQSSRAAVRQLRVTSAPPAADIYVDGRLRGAAPAIVEARPGSHVVRAELIGHASAARMVDVAEDGGKTVIRLDEDPDDGALLDRIGRGTADPANPAVRTALLARAGASHLIAYRADGAMPALRVWSRTEGSRGTLMADPNDPQTAGRLSELVLGTVHVATPAGAEQPREGEGPFYRRWWFWASVAAVAAAAVAVPLALRPDAHVHVRPAP